LKRHDFESFLLGEPLAEAALCGVDKYKVWAYFWLLKKSTIRALNYPRGKIVNSFYPTQVLKSTSLFLSGA